MTIQVLAQVIVPKQNDHRIWCQRHQAALPSKPINMYKNNGVMSLFMVCMVAIGLCSLFTSTANAHEIPPVLQGGVRVEQINVASINSSQSSTGTRIHLGILSERLHEQDKATGVIIVRDECKAAIGDPEHCTVTVFRRFCRVVSTSPYIEQCYWTASHHLQGTWDEKKQCCDVLVDGRKFCAKGAIYQPF